MRRGRRLALIVATAIIVAGCNATPPPSGSPTATPTTTASAPSGQPATLSPSSEPGGATARWESLTPGSPAPAPRSGHTWVGDPSSGVAYLFGGQGQSEPLDDLWTYDLAADRWRPTARTGETPPARSGHVAAWIDGIGAVIFGGRLDAAVANDLWAYDPDAGAWRTVDTTGPTPPARTDACAAMRPDGRWWISHGTGVDGNPLGDTWALDPGASTWSAITVGGTSAPPLSGSDCWWLDAERLVLVGGRGADGRPNGDVWVLTAGSDTSSWERLPATTPPRGFAAATETTEGLAVFGGRGADDALLGDLYVQDRKTLEAIPYQPADAAPSARSDGAFIDDPASERILFFGGTDAAGPSGELWSLRLS
jgi:hypothetical protein